MFFLRITKNEIARSYRRGVHRAYKSYRRIIRGGARFSYVRPGPFTGTDGTFWGDGPSYSGRCQTPADGRSARRDVCRRAADSRDRVGLAYSAGVTRTLGVELPVRTRGRRSAKTPRVRHALPEIVRGSAVAQAIERGRRPPVRSAPRKPERPTAEDVRLSRPCRVLTG